MNKRFGFTLAEVLITLAIIGVVAAMTIPTMIANYQKEQTTTQLKKVYNTMQNAIRASEVENGPYSSWDTSLSGVVFAQTYLLPYLNYNSFKQIGTSYTCKYFDNATNCTCSTYYAIILPDGAYVLFTNAAISTLKLIFVDVNGPKPPNRHSRDVFTFEFDQTYGFSTEGVNYIKKGIFAGRTSLFTAMHGCKSSNTSWDYCAALIIYDGWEIADDYPW